MTGPASGIRVGLVEDEPAMRRRLVEAIEAAEGMHVVLEAGRAEEALAWLGCHALDVMLVDLGLPDRPGLEVIAACRRSQPACQVMVVTLFADESNVIRAFEAGASGYLMKDGSQADLAEHVRQLHAGGSPVSPMIARQMLRRWQQAAAGPARPAPPTAARPPELGGAPGPVPAEPLTAREADVLELVARGFNYVEVADRLGVAVSTVRTHVRSVYGKLDVHNKTEAVFEARQLGLLR